MVTAIATPAAIVCSSRRKDQIFSYSASITRATFSLAFVSFNKSSSSVNLCSFLGKFHQTSDEMLTSFSARGSQFLCPVICEVDGCKEGDAKKQRVAYAITVKSDETTNRRVLDIQNSVSSERKKMLKVERNPKRLNNSVSQRNKLECYQVIQYPLKTESTMGNILRHNTLVFVVHKDADKKSIRDAVKKLFKIELKKVNTSIMPDGTKKAYVMLTPNHSALDVAKKIKAI
ncbi:large ribosomal subunit protein uL23 isoform X1 [Solanum lycopersicum]|uniref:Ribosomal protein L23/L25 N-terminal domain-containing protein n=1 Tax=Solanum lycopersicum TaxID=4081 RepID=A0A3Q7FAW1_SOLLC|nr:60S ribosomal protein L23a isoform X1 [Solanum lycopersicum]XP_025885487.1 60S ribosomal protein L23a isoform X1 [Solanum lycopersicum]XP_025885488.1 60S ribosomal protein L23a isoform X1 [Solanum lycopersicum]